MQDNAVLNSVSINDHDDCSRACLITAPAMALLHKRRALNEGAER